MRRSAALSKEYAQKRAALIDPEKANCKVRTGQPVHGDTTYLTVVDRNGNIASWIQSVYAEFGSGLTVEGMGFILQNRGGGFTLDAGHPNILAGGKRPFHTIIPAFMERGESISDSGSWAAPNQPLAHAQFVSNIVDYGMNMQAAMEAPRFTKRDSPGCDVSIESRVPPHVAAAFRARASDRASAASIRRRWAAARRSCTIRDEDEYAASIRGPRGAVPEPVVR